MEKIERATGDNMKQLLIVLWLCLVVISGALTQSDTAKGDVNADAAAVSVRVLFESAFVRELPTEESEAVASAFENDFLEAIGRNADGMWVQVRRPGREISLGWIARRLIVANFDMTLLPLTDNETGVNGADPVIDTGYAIFIPGEATLRADAINAADSILTLPRMVTIPALERTPDTRWVKVNYLGTIGWVSAFSFHSATDLTPLPIAPETQQSIANVEIIPPEVQLAQAYRLRDYVQPLYDTTLEVVDFWDGLLQGEVYRCDWPAGNYTMIEISQRDIVELPELRGAARLLPRALEDLNNSIVAMQRCGIYTPEELSRAYAQGINARAIFSSTLRQMENVEVLLLPQLDGSAETGE